MKPVTDPALLEQLNGPSAGPVTDPELLKQLNGAAPAPAPAAALPQTMQQKFDAAQAQGPDEGQQFRSGLHHGLSLASKGVADTTKFMLGPLNKPFKKLNEYATSKGYPLAPTEAQLAEGKTKVEQAGTTGAVGQFIGQALPEAIMAPVAEGKLLEVAKNVLPKALQYLAPIVAQIGGNAGTAAALAPENKGQQALGAAEGTVFGGALAKGVGKAWEYGKKSVNRVIEELSPTESAAAARALRAVERTVGKDEVSKAADALGTPTPSMLPRTTAAESGSVKLGAMERGARSRGTSDFAGHDKAVDEAAWNVLKGSTPEADQLKTLEGQHTKIFNEGQALLDKLPFSQKNRAVVSTELRKLRNSNVVQGDATGSSAKQIDSILRAVDNPDTSLGVLAQLYTTVDGSAPGMGLVKDTLKRTLDERSKGQFSNIISGYGTTKDAITAAETAQKLRSKFMPETNIPVTPRAHGESGTPTAMPGIDAAPLRRATAAIMPENAQANMLADQLRGREIYKAPGATSINIGGAEGTATAGLNAGPFWRLRGTIKSVFGPINDKTSKAVDEALLNPTKFLELVDARKAQQEALKPWEAKLEKIIRSGGQVGARIGGSAGE
jgi:hypothetical protein